MKFLKSKSYASVAVLASVVGLTACGGGGGSSSSSEPTTNPGGTAASVVEFKELKGDFSEDVILDSANVYKITGEVNFLAGATLEIPAGTTLYGSTGASYLAINRGAKIEAEGTKDDPIIFTSAQDIAGTAGQNDQGQWGGLTILGSSENNKGERTYEAGTQLYGPIDGVANPNDDSGTLDYVIIKYSGFEVETDKELNGLSLASVGSGTTISNIAVIGSADDGIELWGGTVDLTNVYVYNAGDDSLDTDQGYVGTIENVYVQQVVVDDEVDSRAIEADSLDDDPNTGVGSPQAKVTLKNATLETIGRAVRLREGTGYEFDNVQINVKTSSFIDPTDADYFKNIAAIRISEDKTFAEEQITIASGGLGIKNDAVILETSSKSVAGDVGADGIVTSGLGMYRDEATLDYFRDTSKVMELPKEIVGVSGDMVDEGYLDSAGTAFTTEVATANTVAGVDVTIFDWVAEEVNDQPVVFLTGDIATDTVLDASNLYAINGEVNVLDGYTLTIPAGTTLYGVTGSSYLAVNRGAKIMAEGTADSPIVFTSALDVAGANTGDEQGQWGGLTILGKASANKGERTYEAGTQKYGPDGTGVPGTTCPAGVDAANCGIDDDDSGVLKYVVVKYSGYEVEKDKELNGISLAGVGSGTVIENVASIGSADDGIELWGGTVSIDGLYVYNAGDDSIDTDQGYRGTIKNVLAEQNIVDDEEGSRVIEADGKDESSAGNPASLVTLEDAILRANGRAIRMREGTGYVYDNVQVSVLSTTVDDSLDAIRISQVALSGSNITTAGEGIAIKNYANAANLYRDADTETYFDGLTNVFENDDTTLTITEYDYSWTN